MPTPRTRLLPRGDGVPKPADIYTLAIRSRKSHTTSPSRYPILLSSRPNPNSISQLLKQRYRMARRRAVRGIQLPSPAAQREKIERRRREVREGVRKRPGPKPKLKVRQGEGRALLGGERESPIVIEEESEGEDRPEKAPICFVDDELVEAERVVALEGEGGASRKRRGGFLGPSRGNTPSQVEGQGTRSQTAQTHSVLESDTHRPRKRARVEELPGHDKTIPSPFSDHHRPLAAPSPPSTIIPSIETESSSSADNPVAILDHLKTKVAQLMAIAPGMPISVLYNLLAEMEWDLGRASEAVQRHTSSSSTATPTPVPVAEPEADVKQNGLAHNAGNDHEVVPVDKGYMQDEDVLTKMEHRDHRFWDDEVEDAEMPFTFRSRRKRAVRQPKATAKAITNKEDGTDRTAQGAVNDKNPLEPSERNTNSPSAYSSIFKETITSTKEVSPFPWETFSGANTLQRARKEPLSHKPAQIPTPDKSASPSNSYEPESPTISLDTHSSSSSYEPPSPSVFANSVAPSLSSNPTSLSSFNDAANSSILAASNYSFVSFGQTKPPMSHAATRSRQEDPSHLPISTRELSPTNSSSIDLLDSDSDSGGEDEAYMDHLRSGLRLRSKPNETHSS